MRSRLLLRSFAVWLTMLSVCGPWPLSAQKSKPRKAIAVTSFAMQDLGSLGDLSAGDYVNDNGDVTGTNIYRVGNPFPQRAFLYKNGQMTDLGTLPGATHS